ncbi:MAG TPA: hypothetical protein VGP08_13765 [Pyrinomonadaceae bacterium]|jgi:hypothetical protein|nr:hypothetical protein [Pyrinomonadaceae bacterium]
MTTAPIDSLGDRGPRACRMREEQRARLRHYFLRQLGSAREADDCVRETVRRLRDFMEGRRWEDETGRVLARVMRTAAALCAERLEDKGRPVIEGSAAFIDD